jgi:osmotically-inducible protein OsmY
VLFLLHKLRNINYYKNNKMKNIKKKIILPFILALTVAGCAPAKQYYTDSAITLEVKEKLAMSNNTHALDIHVDTSSGVVTLSGVVGNERERLSANSIAKGVKGVKQVNNALTLPHKVRH